MCSISKFRLSVEDAKEKLIVVSAYFLIAVIVLRGIIAESGTIGHRWDWGIPPASSQLVTMTKYFPYAWNPLFLGLDETYGIPSQLIFYILGVPGFLGFTGDFVSKSLLIFTIILSGYLMYLLIKDILSSDSRITYDKKLLKIPSFLGGYFYALSPLLFNEFVHGVSVHFMAYSIAPLTFLLYRRALFRNNLRYLALATLSIAPFGASLKMVILLLVMMTVYGFFYMPKRTVRMLSYLLIGWFFINFYWILPFFVQAEDVVPAVQAIETTDIILTQSRVHSPTLPQAFDLSNYVKFTDRSFFQATIPDWFYPAWYGIVIGTVILMFSMLLFYPRNKEFLVWIFLVLVSIIFVTGVNPPLGKLVEWFYVNIPIFVIYQSVWVFNFVPTFSYAVLLALTINYVANHFKEKVKIIFVLCFALISIWVAPFYTGDLGGKVDVFKLPPEYERINRIIANKTVQGEDFRVLYLPMSLSPRYEETEYQSKLQGGDPIIMWSPWPQVVADIVPNQYAKKFVTPLEGLLYSKNWSSNISKYLAVLNVKYIVLRKDVRPNFGDFKDRWDHSWVYENLKEASYTELLAEYEYVSLWENKCFLPHIYTIGDMFSNETTLLVPNTLCNKNPTFIEEINLTFTKINPTKYIINVDTSKPFYLIFSEAYHPTWKGYVDGREEKNHFVANEYANGWRINETGSFTIVLEVAPQILVRYGIIISTATLIIFLMMLVKSSFMR